MTLGQNFFLTKTGDDADARVEQLISMMSESDFDLLKGMLQRQFGLEYEEVESHPNNIKTIISGKRICFAKGISSSSRTFMVLHSLGHYYFICEARRKNIDRYSYIYDLRGHQAALHYYETEGKPNALDAPPQMTEQRRKDRVSFEVGANNFAIDLLSKIGFKKGEELIKKYEVGDINYILDVSRGGKAAIMPTDQQYIRKYLCAGLSVDLADTYDDGVYSSKPFDIDAIDWKYIKDIKLEIHFF